MGGLKSVLPTDFPSIGVPWLMEALTALYGKAKVADRIPQVANLVISNVPGPRVPLYLAGARMRTFHPMSIVVHGIALNITVQSYVDQLGFGLIGCRRAVPDVQELAGQLQRAMVSLRRLAEAAAEQAATAASAPVAAVVPPKPARKAAPEAAPSIEALPRISASPTHHASTAAAVAPRVLMKARAAKPLASRAEPALKPNQPTHSSAAPTIVSVRL